MAHNKGALHGGKWEAAELVQVAKNLHAKHSCTTTYPWQRNGMLESINVEDASSGIMLIQQLERAKLPVKSIKVETDKYSKARGTTPSIAVNPVFLPKGAPWRRDFLNEMYAFPEGTHDDQCDVLMGGVQQLLINGASMFDNY